MTYGAVAEDTYEGLLALGDAVGSVPRGLSAAQIAALPTWVVGKGTGGGGDGGGDGGGGGGGEGDEAASPAASSSTTAGSGSGRIKCAICLEAAVPGDVLRTLPCVHSFHQVCVDVWLGVRDTCPLCKPPPPVAPAMLAKGRPGMAARCQWRGGNRQRDRRALSVEGRGKAVVRRRPERALARRRRPVQTGGPRRPVSSGVGAPRPCSVPPAGDRVYLFRKHDVVAAAAVAPAVAAM